ncbi:MAG: PIN domain-containing protein [Nitrospirae bacterium]|nr:PIN domain-containing protein [Nitrospirota bacterium]
MSLVFVDTGGWIGLLVSRDQFHKRAVSHYAALSQQNIPLVTTNYVLTETYTRIRYDDGYAKTLQFHDIVQKAIKIGRLRIEWITPAIHNEAWDILRKYKDQAFSFVDCTSFIVAKKTAVTEVFGFDRGFTTMGFVLKP